MTAHWPGAEAPDPLDRFVRQRAIDATAFIGQWPFRLTSATSVGQLAGYADRYGLAGLCLSHLASLFGFDTRTGNEALFAEAAADPRCWPFAVIDPSEFGWQRELDWAVAEGAKGIRIAPGFHGYRLTDPSVGDLVAATGAVGLPLHVLIRLDDERVRHPRFRVDDPTTVEIAQFLQPAANERRIVVSGVNHWQWTEIDGLLGGVGPGVLGDLWFVNGPLGVVDTLVAGGAGGRFCFGSGTPVQAAAATALQLAAARIGDDELAALCAGNLTALLRH